LTQYTIRPEPLHAPIWGRELIDAEAIRQMDNAMRLPVTVGGALMPDAHVGYGIPIGGVVALENAVAPYMVGVDIACRMMMSIFPPDALQYLRDRSRRERLRQVMRAESRFGIGAEFGPRERRAHEVMDDPAWAEVPQLRRLKDRAHSQLGTSGSGNHFIDAGVLHVGATGGAALGLAPGEYLALMSHSGSRGAGAEVARHYSAVAQKVTPLPGPLRHLAWLPLDGEPGQEYWLAMNLMGRYASANHHSLHRALAGGLKEKPLLQLENHHNFAWRERWQNRDVYVHRKGATPAHEGEIGIIPGSQGHDSFVVRGLGSERSLFSASHGAGRTMSRKRATQTIPKRDRDRWLQERGVELLDSGMDEAPQAYKDIRQVLAHQTDLVEPLATFSPRIVLMSKGGRAED
jgi:tRNA-splicing ligase RtcB (3'-phosphate/5'-hydroxy nucleic acid ligase)